MTSIRSSRAIRSQASHLLLAGALTLVCLSGCSKSWLNPSESPTTRSGWRWPARQEAERRALQEKVASDPFPTAQEQGIESTVTTK